MTKANLLVKETQFSFWMTDLIKDSDLQHLRTPLIWWGIFWQFLCKPGWFAIENAKLDPKTMGNTRVLWLLMPWCPNRHQTISNHHSDSLIIMVPYVLYYKIHIVLQPLNELCSMEVRSSVSHHCFCYWRVHLFIVTMLYVALARDALNSSPPDKMATIWQTTFLNAFSWMKNFVFQ